MKHLFRRFVSVGTAIAMVASISCVTAFAATAQEPALQINGETVVFEDAKPINRNNRVFVPFRATMETLGAEVSYDDGTHTTTAVKGDTTLQFKPGETTVTVTENGQTSSLETSMVISSGTAYVPIRSLGEALHMPVGWDNAEKTALLIDADKLLEEAGSFSLMNRYMDYANNFAQQHYAFKGTFSFSLDMPYDPDVAQLMPITGTGSFEGISEAEKQNMSMAMQLDMTALKDYIAAEAPDEASATLANTVVSALENVTFDYIFDLSTGKLYFQSPVFGMLGMDGDAWYLVDIDGMYASMGMDFSIAELMDMATTTDFESYIADALAAVPLTSVNDYADFKTSIAVFTELFSDNAFQKQGDAYVSDFQFNESNMDIGMTMKIFETGTEISGYQLDAAIGESGTDYLNLSVTQNGNTSVANFTFSIPNLFSMAFDYNMTMEPTDQSALSKPNSNNIIDIMNLEDVDFTTPEPATEEAAEEEVAATEETADTATADENAGPDTAATTPTDTTVEETTDTTADTTTADDATTDVTDETTVDNTVTDTTASDDASATPEETPAA